jgi:periplasmic protein TonB
MPDMSRPVDFMASFGVALFLHVALAFGAVGFGAWSPPGLHPVFQDGDVSLAVTFIAAPGANASRESVKPDTADRGHAKAEAPPAPVLAAPPEELENRAMLDAETENVVPEREVDDERAAGPQDNDRALETEQAPSDAFCPGVSGVVRLQSEIRPYYPLGARLRGEEGVVKVRVRVNPSGRASRCAVERSSGYPALDRAAVDAARRARYVSTRQRARQDEEETTLTFRFRLTE